MWKKYKLIIKRRLYSTPLGEVINEYHFMSESGIYLGYLRFPADGISLDKIVKEYSIRWEFIKPKK